MNRCCRIGCHLLNVFLLIQIIDPELCTFVKHRFFRLIILLDDLQLCFKFLVQKHPPYLWRSWIMLCNPHDKVVHRLVIMGRGGLPDKVCTIRKGNTAGISFLVRKHFCRPVLPDHHRFCGIEIIAAIFLYCKVREQVGGKSGPRQEISVRLPIIGCLDDLKRLLLYLFQ